MVEHRRFGMGSLLDLHQEATLWGMRTRQWRMAVLGLLALLCECGDNARAYTCACTDEVPSELKLSCPAVIAHVELTGVCADAMDASAPPGDPLDAATSDGASPAASQYDLRCGSRTEFPTVCGYFVLGATAAGSCHVELTLASGFTYSTDLQFELRSAKETSDCPSCPPHIAPTVNTVIVSNPDDTCVVDASGG
jgi:hypothetical protein